MEENTEAGRDLIKGEVAGSDATVVGKDVIQNVAKSGDVHVHVEKERTRAKRGGFMPGVEEEFRKVLATHALTLGQLEGKIDRNDMVVMQYVDLMKEQIIDLRSQLNKFAGMAFMPPPNTEIKSWVPMLTMASLLVIAVGVVALVIVLTTGGN